MTEAEKAQARINAMTRVKPITSEGLGKIKHLKVNYTSIDQMPDYKKKKLKQAINYIVDNYNPEFIDLVMSQLNGYPIDEKTTQEDFNLLKKWLDKSKFSDWDFIVPSIDAFQVIEQISPLLKVDMFKIHHGGVEKIRVYERN